MVRESLIHTDFGHDPDDAIALAYLIENNYIPDIISITPGFWDQQYALTGFMSLYSNYLYSTYDFLTVDKKISEEKKYNLGKYKIFVGNSKRVFFPFKDVEIVNKALIIGPAIGLGNNLKCKEMFFQGGYSPNSISPLEKFKGLLSVPSFNPNGSKKDFNLLLESKNIEKKYYIGKNVCHGFTKKDLAKIWIPKNDTVLKFWNQLEDTKAMHDVLAAILFLNKDFGIWSQEKPVWDNGKLTTEPTNEEIYTLIGLNL